MKKRICVLLSFVLIFVMTGCENHAAEGGQENISPKSKVQTEQTINNSEASSKIKSQELFDPDLEAEQEVNMGSKTLVAYFSATGTTKLLAKYAAGILNADLYEIVPKAPYTEEDLVYYTNGRADQEQNDPSSRPEISGSVKNMADYDTIFLGYPKMEYGFNCV